MRSLDLQGPRFSINAFRQAVGRVSIRGEYFANLNCCGHVGLVTGACFSEIGHEAICTDRDEIRIASFEVSYLFTSPAWKASVQGMSPPDGSRLRQRRVRLFGSGIPYFSVSARRHCQMAKLI